jgi:hypothetical protein
MEQLDKKTLVNALRKAKRAYKNGLRYYDDKHKTYNPASRIENILEHVNDLVGFYGLEAYDKHDNNAMRPKYSYVNSGDAYCLTLIYNHDSGRFVYSDIGTIIERENL